MFFSCFFTNSPHFSIFKLPMLHIIIQTFFQLLFSNSSLLIFSIMRKTPRGLVSHNGCQPSLSHMSRMQLVVPSAVNAAVRIDTAI